MAFFRSMDDFMSMGFDDLRASLQAPASSQGPAVPSLASHGELPIRGCGESDKPRCVIRGARGVFFWKTSLLLPSFPSPLLSFLVNAWPARRLEKCAQLRGPRRRWGTTCASPCRPPRRSPRGAHRRTTPSPRGPLRRRRRQQRRAPRLGLRAPATRASPTKPCSLWTRATSSAACRT